MAEILVVDIETTSLNGPPLGRVVDIGICSYDTRTREVRDVYSSRLGYDVSQWSDRERNAWIFTHPGATLTLDDVMRARPAVEVVAEAREVLKGRMVTAYNASFDFDRFLLKEPWCVDVTRVYDIMDATTHAFGHRVKAEEAYQRMFGMCDPAGIGACEQHLGLPDARMEAYMLDWLCVNGYYPTRE